MKNIVFTTAFLFTFLVMKNSMAQTSAQPVRAKLNHIAVYVKDLKKSTVFYKDLLHLEVIDEPFKDGKHVWFTLGAAVQLHLIEGEKQKTVHNKNEHLCFSVISISDFMKVLDQHQVKYENWAGTANEPNVRVDGVKQIYFQDPDGHWLEINDAPKVFANSL
jgi:lactoylglutathione lyase